jgi:hypothetical protein
VAIGQKLFFEMWATTHADAVFELSRQIRVQSKSKAEINTNSGTSPIVKPDALSANQ